MFLRFGEQRLLISSEDELLDALHGIEQTPPGNEVEALWDRKHYVCAVRVSELWHLDKRSGSLWTMSTLTPGDILRDWQPIFALKKIGRFRSDEVKHSIQLFWNRAKLPFPRLGA